MWPIIAMQGKGNGCSMIKHLCTVMVFWAATIAFQPESAWAGPVDTIPTTSLPEGVVTEVRPNSIEIDHVAYGLHPKLVVKIAPGASWSIESLPHNATVRYHVVEGKVDFLLYVPNS
jgi:hypothetical protein